MPAPFVAGVGIFLGALILLAVVLYRESKR